MSNSEIILQKYSEAVSGLTEDCFREVSSKWYDYVINLPFTLRITYLVVVFHSQVINGGFHQYFVSGYGQFAKETIDALIEIGAVEKSKLLYAALTLVNKDNNSDVDFRKKLLTGDIQQLFVGDELFDPLDELDTQYYSNEIENIEYLLGSYLSRS
jgi:Domain of unknown function (DUF4375)